MLFKREQFHQIPASQVCRGHDWIKIPDSADSVFDMPEEVEAFQVEKYFKPQISYQMYKGASVVMMLNIRQGRVSIEPDRVRLEDEWFQVFIVGVDIHSLSQDPYALVVCLFSALCPVHVLKDGFIPRLDV